MGSPLRVVIYCVAREQDKEIARCINSLFPHLDIGLSSDDLASNLTILMHESKEMTINHFLARNGYPFRAQRETTRRGDIPTTWNLYDEHGKNRHIYVGNLYALSRTARDHYDNFTWAEQLRNAQRYRIMQLILPKKDEEPKP